MHKFPGNRSFGNVFLVLALLTACSSHNTGLGLNRSLSEDGVPLWVVQGSSTVKSKSQRVFYGVAAAKLVNNADVSVQASIADQRAKAELQRQLKRYLEVLSRDYIASGSVSKEQFNHAMASAQIERAAKTSESWVAVVEHWVDKSSQQLYSVAELDTAVLKSRLGQLIIDAGFKRYVQQNADTAFDRIARNSL